MCLVNPDDRESAFLSRSSAFETEQGNRSAEANLASRMVGWMYNYRTCSSLADCRDTLRNHSQLSSMLCSLVSIVLYT